MIQAHIKQKLGLHSVTEFSEKATQWVAAIDAAKSAIKEAIEKRRPILSDIGLLTNAEADVADSFAAEALF